MYNETGFDVMYNYLIETFPALTDASVPELKDVVWTVFANSTESFVPDRSSIIKRMEKIKSPAKTPADLYRIISDLCSTWLITLERNDVPMLWSVVLSGEKKTVYIVYLSVEDAQYEMKDGYGPVATRMGSIVDFLKYAKDVDAIAINPHGTTITISSVAVIKAYSVVRTIQSCIEQYVEHGIKGECFFPLLIEYVDDRPAHFELKDGTTGTGTIDEIVRDELGDASAMIFLTEEKQKITIGIDDIAFYKVIPD